MKMKERTRQSMYGFYMMKSCLRKRKRREFAERRDRECEGMTPEERSRWIDMQKEEGLSIVVP